jgi:hypothetical protein
MRHVRAGGVVEATPRPPALLVSAGRSPGARGRGDERRRVLLAQGGYYVATGVLPFVSRRAFEALTGPKREWCWCKPWAAWSQSSGERW